MPECKKCQSRFPNKLIIDGKRRNLSTRKYCLICSPFGIHNTKVLTDQHEDRVCQICERGFKYARKKGHQKTICNSCAVRKYQREKKSFAVSFYGGKCIVCGYCKCIDALEFHHRDESSKEEAPSEAIIKWSWERAKKELDKCDLVCSNCHKEIHAEQHLSTREKINRWQNERDNHAG